MAVFIVGKTSCPLCERIIEEGEAVVSFSPFVANELDPLWIFSDGVFHAACFYREPLAQKAQLRYQELQRRTGPGNRFCVVCEEEIKYPDDYLTLGHLTEDETHPLYRFNYTQAHRSCLAKWPELSGLCKELKEFNESEAWGGSSLERLLAQLTKYLPSPQEQEKDVDVRVPRAAPELKRPERKAE